MQKANCLLVTAAPLCTDQLHIMLVTLWPNAAAVAQHVWCHVLGMTHETQAVWPCDEHKCVVEPSMPSACVDNLFVTTPEDSTALACCSSNSVLWLTVMIAVLYLTSIIPLTSWGQQGANIQKRHA